MCSWFHGNELAKSTYILRTYYRELGSLLYPFLLVTSRRNCNFFFRDSSIYFFSGHNVHVYTYLRILEYSGPSNWDQMTYWNVSCAIYLSSTFDFLLDHRFKNMYFFYQFFYILFLFGPKIWIKTYFHLDFEFEIIVFFYIYLNLLKNIYQCRVKV